MKNQGKNDYKEVLKKLILNERRALKQAGYTDQQINEIFDNKFVRTVSDRAKSLFDKGRDISPIKSRPVPDDYSKDTFSIEDLVDLILSDPSVPSYIKDVAATLEYPGEAGLSAQQSTETDVDFPDQLPDEIPDADALAPVGDKYGFDRDMRAAVSATSKEPPKQKSYPALDKRAEKIASGKMKKSEGSGAKSKKDEPASKPQVASDKQKETDSRQSGGRSTKPSDRAQKRENKPSPNKRSSRKASLKEAIFDRLSEKDRKDPAVQKLIEAIEAQMKKKS